MQKASPELVTTVGSFGSPLDTYKKSGTQLYSSSRAASRNSSWEGADFPNREEARPFKLVGGGGHCGIVKPMQQPCDLACHIIIPASRIRPKIHPPMQS